MKLAKSAKDFFANKEAGKVSMVIGWQDSFALEEENGDEWRFSRADRKPPELREYYELGLRTANLAYQLSDQFGGGVLDPEAPPDHPRASTSSARCRTSASWSMSADTTAGQDGTSTSCRHGPPAGRLLRTGVARRSTMIRATAATA